MTRIDTQRARELIAEGESLRSTARILGCDSGALSRALRRNVQPDDSPEQPATRVEVRGDGIEVDSRDLTALADPEALLRRRGLDPDEWLHTGTSITEWGRDPETGEPYQRLKATWKRRADLAILRPASDVEAVPIVRRERDPDQPWLGVIVGDRHAPHHDEALHSAYLQFLDELRPDRGFDVGDLLDLPSPSRHRRNPKWHVDPQECIQAGFEIKKDERQASPETEWDFIPGNHDVRIKLYLLEGGEPGLAMLAPARFDESEPPETPAMALSRLLHFDRLGINCVEPDGEYGDGTLEVCENFELIHGEGTSMTAADKELERFGLSFGQGHSHRKRTVFRTAYKQGRPITHVGIEVGTMALITKEGLGYHRRPNWQAGFGTVTVWPDGRFNVEHAIWAGGSLFWRDRRWRP